MVVTFLSMDKEKNKTRFQSEAFLNENELIFEDKSSPDTKIKLIFLEDSLRLERFGCVNMNMHFCKDKPTLGTYQNKDGLSFDFEVHTKILEIEETKIKVSYDMIVNEEISSSLTFQVVLIQN